jgi:hypothetical protein
MMEPAALHAIRSLSDAQRPPDVVQDPGDLYWYRTLTVTKADGEIVTVRRRACEDCWKSMPQYVHNAGGFVSPESDMEIPGRKTRTLTLGTRHDGSAITGVETTPRAVCRECFLMAFDRMHGRKPPQVVPDEVRGEDVIVPEPVAQNAETVPEVA